MRGHRVWILLLMGVCLLVGMIPAVAQSDAAKCIEGVDYAAQGEDDLNAAKFVDAAEAYTCAIEADPETSELYYMRGFAYLMSLQYQAALDDYEQFDRMERSDQFVHFYIGQAYIGLNEPETAIEEFDIFIRNYPDYPLVSEAYFNRGNAYGILEDFERAIEDFDAAIDVNENFAQAYLNRGWAHANLYHYEDAGADFTTAIELNPEMANMYFAVQGRGITAAYYVEALDNLNTANAALLDNPDSAKTYRQRAVAYFGLGATDDAMNDLNHTLELNPTDAEAFFYRGGVYSLWGEVDNAIDDYTQAIELTENPQYYRARGGLYMYMEDYELAAQDLSYVLDINPDDQGVYLTRGIVYSQMDADADAASDFLEYANRIEIKAFDGGTLTVNEPETVRMSTGWVYRFQFEAVAGERLKITADASDRAITLDPLVIVLAPDGTPINANDDREMNVASESIIPDFEVPEDGVYTLILTHAGGPREGSMEVMVQPGR